MSAPDDQAQRELEQRALRNVRGLVDKLDHDEKLEGRAQKRVFMAIIGGAVALALVIVAIISLGNRSTSAVEVRAPAKGAAPAGK